tara:strand:+ start:549 stop:1889 length:1341 start_codon:yes stop_codon:yes gene_type:complete
MRIILSLILFINFIFCSYNQFNQAFIDVAKNQSSSIVSIISEKTQKQNNMFFFNPFFDDFGDQFEQEERKSQSLGSGVIIDNDKGYIITNNHVIENAEEIKVILYDKREFDAKIIGTDPLSDLAVIQIEPDNLEKAKFGDSNLLQIGEWVMAIGSPFGLHLNHTVTAGIVSAVGRSDVISRMNFENFIQHDAAINPGNSGGGLFNLNGELIGINTAIATDGFSKSNAGVGFAIPVNQAKRVVEDLITSGKVSRGWLGVQIQDIDDSMQKALKLNSKKGAFIASVGKDSPADLGGLKEKDVIIAMNAIEIDDTNQLKNKVSSAKPGEMIIFTVIRNGNNETVMITLGTRPDQGSMKDVFSLNSFDKLGMKVENNPDGEGILILDIDPKSEAYSKNIRKGNLITEIGNDTIETVEDYNLSLENYEVGDPIMIRIINNGNPRYEAFEIK